MARHSVLKNAATAVFSLIASLVQVMLGGFIWLGKRAKTTKTNLAYILRRFIQSMVLILALDGAAVVFGYFGATRIALVILIVPTVMMIGWFLVINSLLKAINSIGQAVPFMGFLCLVGRAENLGLLSVIQLTLFGVLLGAPSAIGPLWASVIWGVICISIMLFVYALVKGTHSYVPFVICITLVVLIIGWQGFARAFPGSARAVTAFAESVQKEHQLKAVDYETYAWETKAVVVKSAVVIPQTGDNISSGEQKYKYLLPNTPLRVSDRETETIQRNGNVYLQVILPVDLKQFGCLLTVQASSHGLSSDRCDYRGTGEFNPNQIYLISTDKVDLGKESLPPREVISHDSIVTATSQNNQNQRLAESITIQVAQNNQNWTPSLQFKKGECAELIPSGMVQARADRPPTGPGGDSVHCDTRADSTYTCNIGGLEARVNINDYNSGTLVYQSKRWLAETSGILSFRTIDYKGENGFHGDGAYTVTVKRVPCSS